VQVLNFHNRNEKKIFISIKKKQTIFALQIVMVGKASMNKLVNGICRFLPTLYISPFLFMVLGLYSSAHQITSVLATLVLTFHQQIL
jgi:hypothetical protein